MKILLIHQYYKTPEEGGAIRSFYIAGHLASLGHDVHVITAYNKKKYSAQVRGKVTLHYLPVYYTNHLSFWSRIHAFYRFVRKSLKLIKKLQPVDLNYVITTPLSTGIIALHAKWRLGIPYIFEVGDLWPDAPVQLGVLKNKLLIKIAYTLEKTAYREAEQLVALSPEIRQAIKDKVPKKTVEVITNMADTQFFSFEPKLKDLVAKYNVQGKFVIAYTGTVGVANHLEYLLMLAESSQPNRNIHFLIAGSGARWGAIKAQAAKREISNITFTNATNKEGVREIMNVADAVYISYKNVPVLFTGSPNKLFDGLAAGKLIIVNFDGWIKDLLDDHRCGFSYSPENPQEFTNNIIPYINDKALLQYAQDNARALAFQFTPEIQLEKLTRLLSRFNNGHKEQ